MFFLSAFDVLQPSVIFDVPFFFQPLINFVHVFHEPFVHLFNVHTISKYSILITDFSLCFSLSISASDKQCFALFLFYRVAKSNNLVSSQCTLKNLALVSGFQILGYFYISMLYFLAGRNALIFSFHFISLFPFHFFSLLVFAKVNAQMLTFHFIILLFSSGGCKCNHRNNLVY